MYDSVLDTSLLEVKRFSAFSILFFSGLPSQAILNRKIKNI